MDKRINIGKYHIDMSIFSKTDYFIHLFSIWISKPVLFINNAKAWDFGKFIIFGWDYEKHHFFFYIRNNGCFIQILPKFIIDKTWFDID